MLVSMTARCIDGELNVLRGQLIRWHRVSIECVYGVAQLATRSFAHQFPHHGLTPFTGSALPLVFAWLCNQALRMSDRSGVVSR